MLYQVQFDHEDDFVEAETFAEAITVWQGAMAIANGEPWTEEPESVLRVSEKPVLRRRPDPDLPIDLLTGKPIELDSRAGA